MVLHVISAPEEPVNGKIDGFYHYLAKQRQDGLHYSLRTSYHAVDCCQFYQQPLIVKVADYRLFVQRLRS